MNGVVPGNAIQASELSGSVSVVCLQVLVHNSQGEQGCQKPGLTEAKHQNAAKEAKQVG